MMSVWSDPKLNYVPWNDFFSWSRNISIDLRQVLAIVVASRPL